MNRYCTQCSASFFIGENDRRFLSQLSPSIDGKVFPIPFPTLCPDCRFQRRLSHRHETALYRRKCDLTGKEIVSAISPDKPYKVYNPADYWSDRWEPLSFGRPFTFERDFFSQFAELRLAVPRLSLLVDLRNENSDYVNQANEVRNCYLIWGGVANEDCYYCYRVLNSKSCVDCSFTTASELCCGCFDCNSCYNSIYLEKCLNCHDSAFLFDCHGCSECFFSSNLRNKRWYFMNQPLSADEYRAKLVEYRFSDSAVLRPVHTNFLKNRQLFHHRALHQINCDNSTGDDLTNCRNANHCFNCLELEDCSRCFLLFNSKNCSDVSYGWDNCEWCYEGATIGEHSYNAQFCTDSWNIQDCYYCDTCINSKDCFGCIGLNGKRHCILNMQYSDSEYYSMLGQIFDHLQRTKESGEMFPISMSVVCYNETPAQLYFPLTREQALARKYRWKDKDPKEYKKSSAELPQRLEETPDDILKAVLSCERCEKNYRLIKQELDFYRKMKLALPRECCDCRRDRRFLLRNPRTLWDAQCSACSAPMQTSFPKDKRGSILCEQCYLAAVY